MKHNKILKASAIAASLIFASSNVMASDITDKKETFSVSGGYSQTSFDNIIDDKSAIQMGLKYNTLNFFDVDNSYVLNLRATFDSGSDDYTASFLGAGAGYKLDRWYGELFVEYSDMVLSESVSASGMSYGAELEYTLYKTDDKIKYIGLLSSKKHTTNEEFGLGLRYRTTTYTYDISLLSDSTATNIDAYIFYKFNMN